MTTTARSIFAVSSAAFIFGSAAMWSCGKSDLNYAGPQKIEGEQPPSPIAVTPVDGHLVKSQSGTLDLAPGGAGVGGTLNYTIYSDG
ncbi:MAG: hypothetical protein NTV34_09145 [Proteobacteria bacterium]|nr:hypothetical protein [Pseudomonadota bacterium]